jgi:hypothetical protein
LLQDLLDHALWRVFMAAGEDCLLASAHDAGWVARMPWKQGPSNDGCFLKILDQIR